jgi:hypothetical protein
MMILACYGDEKSEWAVIDAVRASAAKTGQSGVSTPDKRLALTDGGP